jgi:hypothetical protein
MGKVEIYFNEAAHKYTDNFNNAYTSVTTVIGQYENKFSDKEFDIARACEAIGRNPRHPKYPKYKGKSANDILAEWKQTRDEACHIGNTKHNYLETSVKSSTGFFDLFKPKTGKLYTIKDLVEGDGSLGKLNLDYFLKSGVKETYPEIYNIIENFVTNGWSIYSEICTYDYDLLIAGLIDILFVKGDKFVILDWKTNKTDLKFESGYYDKDRDGNPISFIHTDQKLKYPLNMLPQSKGNIYTLQLSTYAKLTEKFGLTNVGLILCHIKHDYYTLDEAMHLNKIELVGLNKVHIHMISYIKDHVNMMFMDFSTKVK